jgi:hypothetical protein
MGCKHPEGSGPMGKGTDEAEKEYLRIILSKAETIK